MSQQTNYVHALVAKTAIKQLQKTKAMLIEHDMIEQKYINLYDIQIEELEKKIPAELKITIVEPIKESVEI